MARDPAQTFLSPLGNLPKYLPVYTRTGTPLIIRLAATLTASPPSKSSPLLWRKNFPRIFNTLQAIMYK